jgi:hypothetical protein
VAAGLAAAAGAGVAAGLAAAGTTTGVLIPKALFLALAVATREAALSPTTIVLVLPP